MAEIWQMEFGCHWNNPLYQYECHGMYVDGKQLCPHVWDPRNQIRKIRHDPACPVGKLLQTRVKATGMKIVVDPGVPAGEIRVSDPEIAIYLKKAVEAPTKWEEPS